MNSVIWTTALGQTRIGATAEQVDFPTIDEEPVTVAEVLRHLKWPTGTPDELDIPRWIRTARGIVERETKLALAPQGWNLYLDQWAGFPGWIDLPRAPVVSVDDVVTIGADLDETDVDAGSYWADLSARPGRLVFSSAPTMARVVGAVRVHYNAGYVDKAAVPPDLIRAVLLLIADIAMHRGDEREPRAEPSVPMGVESLINRYVIPSVA